jgi:metal-dependent amidase/aminoacylase/carboxypeptidase family protein
MRERLIEISDFIWENPEIGFKEFKALNLLTSELKSSGFEVETGIVGLETSFRATAHGKGSGPVLGLIAQYDARLWGTAPGHNCSHNLMSASMIGAAIALNKIMPQLHGTIQVIGTPAEEGGGGKPIMLERGAFKGVDVCMMWHGWWATVVDWYCRASVGIDIRYSSESQESNALDALVQTINTINGMRQYLRNDIEIFTVITDTGTSLDDPRWALSSMRIEHTGLRVRISTGQTVPDYSTMTHPISKVIPARQALEIQRSYLKELIKKIETCARSIATMTGTKVTLEFPASLHYDAIRTDLTMNRALEENLVQLGERVEKWIPGTSWTVPVGTDMGNISQVIPTIYPFIKIGDNLGHHSQEFLEASHSPKGHEGMIVGAKAMAMTSIDLLEQPNLMQMIQKDFRRTPLL